MGMSLWGIGASLLFSAVGYFYIKRGRAESDVTRIVCGALLLLFPYFVSKTLYIVAVGLAISAAPYFFDGD
jgi:hypothetical protein